MPCTDMSQEPTTSDSSSAGLNGVSTQAQYRQLADVTGRELQNVGDSLDLDVHYSPVLMGTSTR
jgi:hypothetical protein